MHALGTAIDALNSALEDRECESVYNDSCHPEDDDPCWKCGLTAALDEAEAIYYAAQDSSQTERYKVWVQIERIADEGSGETYENIGLPDPLATRNTLAAAQAFIRTLPGWRPEGSDNRNPRP